MEEHVHKTSEHKHHTSKKGIDPNMKMLVMTIALALLILLSGVQAVQLVSLKNTLNEDLETLTASSSKKAVSTGSSSGTLSDNLNNLPSMVGGC